MPPGACSAHLEYLFCLGEGDGQPQGIASTIRAGLRETCMAGSFYRWEVGVCLYWVSKVHVMRQGPLL